jgi:hypothetical protein
LRVVWSEVLGEFLILDASALVAFDIALPTDFQAVTTWLLLAI